MKCLLSCCFLSLSLSLSLSLFLTFPILFTLSLNPSSCRNCEPICCSSSTPLKLSPSEVFASFIHSLSRSLTHPLTRPFPGRLGFSHPSSWDIALQRVESHNLFLDWIITWWISSRLGLFQAGGSFVFERRTMVQSTFGKVSEGF